MLMALLVTLTRMRFPMCMCSLAEKLQVGDRHFSFLVPSLSNQPVRVHAWDCVNGDELEHRGQFKSHTKIHVLTCERGLKDNKIIKEDKTTV